MLHRKGFTLIEMLLCLVLLGFIVTLTLPKLKGVMDDWKLHMVVREITFQLRKTQITAIRENCTLRVVCLYQSEEQRIVRYYGLKPQYPYYTLPSSIKIVNPSTLNISYNPKGTPSIGCTIRVTNRMNTRSAIVIQPVSGRILIRAD